MKKRCAIYTRKSSEEGLEQAFNSLHAQREAGEAYINSQKHEGWIVLRTAYDDGGFSGGTMERPALVQLIADIAQGKIDVVVVYKVDRLSRSLADFVRIIERFDQQGVSFVSVTQQFNTSTSMGRLTLNVLLSFAQFEREVTGERIRDKIAASKKKGMWMGGSVPLGYDVIDKRLIVNKREARQVNRIYTLYLSCGCVRKVKAILDQGKLTGKSGRPFSRGALYTLLKNPLYRGHVAHKGKHYPGQHEGIIAPGIWQQVQEKLACHAGHKRKARTVDPSLLTGLLYDDQGHPMSPTHARKQSKRYRYYISQAILQFKGKEAGSVIRLPAREIESPVLRAIRNMLNDPQQLTQAIAYQSYSAQETKSLIKQGTLLASRLESESPHEQISILNRMVRKIMISKNEIQGQLLQQGLYNILADGNSEVVPNPNLVYEINIPVKLKRCGIETKLIIAGPTEETAHVQTIKAIQKALTKSLEWHGQLVTGKARSINAIARNEKVTPRYIGRQIKLAYLAPDIMMAIYNSEVPSGLSLGTLIKKVPLDWEEQRKMLGFGPQNAEQGLAKSAFEKLP